MDPFEGIVSKPLMKPVMMEILFQMMVAQIHALLNLDLDVMKIQIHKVQKILHQSAYPSTVEIMRLSSVSNAMMVTQHHWMAATTSASWKFAVTIL